MWPSPSSLFLIFPSISRGVSSLLLVSKFFEHHPFTQEDQVSSEGTTPVSDLCPSLPPSDSSGWVLSWISLCHKLPVNKCGYSFEQIGTILCGTASKTSWIWGRKSTALYGLECLELKLEWCCQSGRICGSEFDCLGSVLARVCHSTLLFYNPPGDLDRKWLEI